MSEDATASADLHSRGSTVDVSQIEDRVREAIELGLNISELIGTGERVISELPEGLIHDLSSAIVEGKKPISHLLRKKLVKENDKLVAHPEGELAPSDAVQEHSDAESEEQCTSNNAAMASGSGSPSMPSPDPNARGPGIHENESQQPPNRWTPNSRPLSSSQLRNEPRPASVNAHSSSYQTGEPAPRNLSRQISSASTRSPPAPGQDQGTFFEGKGMLRVRDGKVEVVEWRARSPKSRRHNHRRSQNSKLTFQEPPEFASSSRRPPAHGAPIQVFQTGDVEDRQEKSRFSGRRNATGHSVSGNTGIQPKEETRKWRDHLKMREAALEWLSGQQTIRLKLRNLLLKDDPEPKVQSRPRPSTATRISPLERNSTESRLPSERILQRLRRGDTRGDGNITFGALVRALNANRSNLEILRPPPRTRRANSSKRISNGILFPTPAPDRLDRQEPGKALRLNPRPSRADSLYTPSANPKEFDLNRCGPGELAYHELDDVFSAMDIENTGRIGIEDFVKFVMHGLKAPERRVPKYGYDAARRSQSADPAARKPPTGRKSPYATPVFEIDPAWERLLGQAYRRRVKRGNGGLEFEDLLTALDDVGLAPQSVDSKADDGNPYKIADVYRVFEHTVFARKASGAEAAAAPEAVEKSTESWDPELNPARRSGANQSSVLSAQRDGAKAGSSRPGKTRIEQLVPIPPAVQAGGAMQMRRGGHRLMQEEEEKSEEGEEDVDIDEGSWGSEDEKSSSDGNRGGVQLVVPTEDIGFQANSTQASQVNTTFSSGGKPDTDETGTKMLSFKEFKACVKKLVLKAGGMWPPREPPPPSKAIQVGGSRPEFTPTTSPGGTVMSVYDDEIDSAAWSPQSNHTQRREPHFNDRTDDKKIARHDQRWPSDMSASRTRRPVSASAAQHSSSLGQGTTWGGQSPMGGGGGWAAPGRIRPHSVTGGRREFRAGEQEDEARGDSDTGEEGRGYGESGARSVRVAQDDSAVGDRKSVV